MLLPFQRARLARNFVICLSGSTIFICSTAVGAGPMDTGILPSPDELLTSEGVDVVSGNFVQSHEDIVIGGKGIGRLSITRRSPHQYTVWQDNSVPILSIAGSINISYDQTVYSFASNGTVEASGRGGKLTPTSNGKYILTTRDGDRVFFDVDYIGAGGVTFASKVIKANGIKIVYSYQFNGSALNLNFYRVVRSQTSLGYGFKYYYKDVPSAQFKPIFERKSQIEAFSIQCASGTCVDTVQASVQYAYPSTVSSQYPDGDERMSSYFDQFGKETRYTYEGANGVFFTERGPLDSVPRLTSTHSVDTINNSSTIKLLDASGERRFIDAPAPSFNSTYYTQDRNMDIIDQNNNVTRILKSVRKVTVYPFVAMPVQKTDALGRVTLYEYDVYGRMIEKKLPEQNKIVFSYDYRGNITSRSEIDKSGAAQLVETAVFPTDCDDQNFRICNKPTRRMDAKGNQYDYTWDPLSGMILSATGPADASGVRPVTSYGYTAFTGVDGAQFYLLTSRSDLVSLGNSVTENYTYDPSSHFTMREKTKTAGGVILRTCYTYDEAGNQLSETAPRAGLASCP